MIEATQQSTGAPSNLYPGWNVARVARRTHADINPLPSAWILRGSMTQLNLSRQNIAVTPSKNVIDFANIPLQNVHDSVPLWLLWALGQTVEQVKGEI